MCKGGISRKEGCPPKLICIQLLSVCFVSHCNNNNARNTGELFAKNRRGLLCSYNTIHSHTAEEEKSSHAMWTGGHVTVCWLVEYVNGKFRTPLWKKSVAFKVTRSRIKDQATTRIATTERARLLYSNSHKTPSRICISKSEQETVSNNGNGTTRKVFNSD